MTHGCGSVSSAGVSSFSGFNAGTSAAVVLAGSNAARNSRASDNDIDCVECCAATCVLCATGLGYLLCIKKMTKFTRTILTWFWMLTIGVSLALIVGLGVYGVNKTPAAYTDMRIVDQGYSTLMCTAFQIKASTTMDAFLLPEKPKVDMSQRQGYNMTSNMYIRRKSYEYWGFYLLEGSRISVYSCSIGSSVTLKVIKGFNNLQTWIHDDSCSGCILESRHISSGRTCIFIETPDYDKYILDVLDSNDYYFVYVTSGFSADVKAKFYVNRTLYDVSSATHQCTNVYTCFFELSYQSAEVVVYHMGIGGTPSTVDVKTHCLPQAGMYIAFFIVPPLALGVILTILIRKKCSDPVNVTTRRRRERPRVQLRNEGPSSRTPLLSSVGNPIGVVSGQPRPSPGASRLRNPVAEENDDPPKYEDIEGQEEPPTYEETLNLQRK